MSIEQNYDTIRKLQKYIGETIPPFEIMDVISMSVSTPVNNVCEFVKRDLNVSGILSATVTFNVDNRLMNVSIDPIDSMDNHSVYVCLLKDTDRGCVTIGNGDNFIKIDNDSLTTSVYIPTENMTSDTPCLWRAVLVVVDDIRGTPWEKAYIFSKDNKLYCKYTSGISIDVYRIVSMQQIELFWSSKLKIIQLVYLDGNTVRTLTVEAVNLEFDKELDPNIRHDVLNTWKELKCI